MKHTSNLNYLVGITIVILSMLYVGTAHSTETTLRIGKYQIGLTLAPLSAAAAWRTSNGYQCRFANSSELPMIVSAIKKMTPEKAVEYVESISQSRALTHDENLFCNKLYELFTLVVAPAKKASRPTKDMTATKYTGNRVSSLFQCEGKLIKKYRKNMNWYKIKGRDETALCGEY